MADQGFLKRQTFGDLRDLIVRRHAEHATVTVAPDDNLLVAYGRMKLYDVSQLPVLEDDRVTGIIDEEDILLTVYENEDHFKSPVSSAMTSRLETLQAGEPIDRLMPIFKRGHVAIVLQGETLAGLITRIDLLNYLRRRMK